MNARQITTLVLVGAIGFLLVYSVNYTLPAFGTFPERQLGATTENAVGQWILDNAPAQTGAANVVTAVVWGYRGYDTFGEATVLFTAVVGVLAVLRAIGRED